MGVTGDGCGSAPCTSLQVMTSVPPDTEPGWARIQSGRCESISSEKQSSAQRSITKVRPRWPKIIIGPCGTPSSKLLTSTVITPRYVLCFLIFFNPINLNQREAGTTDRNHSGETAELSQSSESCQAAEISSRNKAGVGLRHTTEPRWMIKERLIII